MRSRRKDRTHLLGHKRVRHTLEVASDHVDRDADDKAAGFMSATRNGFHDAVVAAGYDVETVLGELLPEPLRGDIFVGILFNARAAKNSDCGHSRSLCRLAPRVRLAKLRQPWVGRTAIA
jgi:hypothetical protein